MNDSGRFKSSPQLVYSCLYALPFIGMLFLVAPTVSVLGGIYAKYHGLSLAEIASAIFVSRIFDALTDPAIGWVSDYHKVKYGSRKFLISVGGILLSPCAYFLCNPSAETGVLYFGFWYSLFYLAMTLVSIPYTAWANEFTKDAKDKTLVFSLVAIAGKLGGGLFYILPLLPFFSNSEITPKVLEFSALTGAIIFLPALFFALYFIPNGNRDEAIIKKLRSGKNVAARMRIFIILTELFNNKPFIIYILANMFLGFGIGMWEGLLFIYVDSYLRLGEYFSEISLWAMIGGAVSIPAWYKISLLLGKRSAWLVSIFVFAVAFLLTGILTPQISNTAFLSIIYLLIVFSSGGMVVVSAPILCDIADFGRFKNGTERTAQYFSFFYVLQKFQFSLGSGLGIGIAAWFGFNVNTATHDDLSIYGLKLAASILPLIFVVIAMYFVANMPLTERRMEIVRKRLSRASAKVVER